MPIDERLRAGLPTALDDVRPDVDADLASCCCRAGRRSRLRRAAYAVGLVAAAVVAAVTLGLGGSDSRRSVDPVAPGGEVRVLDSGRGSAEDPAPLEPGRYAIPFIGAETTRRGGRSRCRPGGDRTGCSWLRVRTWTRTCGGSSCSP